MFYFVFVLRCAVCEDSAPFLFRISGGIGRRLVSVVKMHEQYHGQGNHTVNALHTYNRKLKRKDWLQQFPVRGRAYPRIINLNLILWQKNQKKEKKSKRS